MPKQPDLKHVANEIRAYIRSQGWRPFLEYEGMTRFTNSYQITEGCLWVVACGACIRCTDGEILDIKNQSKLASDVDVVHLYTSRYMTGDTLKADATKLLARLRKELGAK